MSSIDHRIVEMKFNNKQFEKGVETSLKSLENLNKGLNLDQAKAGLAGLSEQARNFQLDGISSGVENISSKFSILGAIGFSVLNDLTSRAISFGSGLVANVLNPIVEGGRKRALNMEQAKFQFEGLKMDVEKTMDAALYAVKGTAYGLDEAAVAAASLGASQVPIEQMGTALRSISGVAALAGSSYSDVAHVFTRVAGQGRLMAVDLNSLAARGVNAAATMAEQFGITEAEVRKMVSEGKISFEMFSQSMDAAFGEHATKANETYTGSLSNMRAALARIGASVVGPRLEHMRDIFNSITPVIDKMADALTPVINLINRLSAEASKGLVSFFEGIDLRGLSGAMPAISAGLSNIISGIKSFFGAIRGAFTEIFPPMTADKIRDIARSFWEISKRFKMGEETAENLRRTFRGVFSVLKLGWTIVSKLAGFFINLFGQIFKGSSGIFEFTALIGDFVYGMSTAIIEGNFFTKFFEVLGKVIMAPINAMKDLIGWVGSLFESFNNADTSGMTTIQKIGQALGDIFGWLGGVFKSVISFFQPLIDGVTDLVKSLFGLIKGAIDGATLGDVIGAAFAVAAGGAAWKIGNAFKNIGWAILRVIRDIRGSFGFAELAQQVRIVVTRMTTTLKTMQNQLRAKTLLSIALAVGVLAASAVVLARVDPVRLASAVGAMAAMFTQLVVSLAVFEKLPQGVGTGRLFGIAAAFTVLGVALLILSSAVVKLSKLDWDELAKGISAVSALLIVMSVSSRIMGSSSGSLMRTSILLITLAVAIKILASATSDFANMDWDKMLQGLAGVGAVLVGLALFTKLAKVSKGAATQGVGILLLATALKILASAVVDLGSMDVNQLMVGVGALAGVLTMLAIFTKVTSGATKIISTAVALVVLGAAIKIFASGMKDFSSMEMDEIGRGIVGIGGALLAIGIAMNLMPKNMILTATGLVIVGAALKIIASALVTMGGMTWDEIGRGMVVLGGSLIILAVAMLIMQKAIGGAIALIVAAGALAILAPILAMLGGLGWDVIGTGLGALAALLGILAVAGLLMIPALPGLLGLALAVALIGTATFAAGTGLLAFATALTIFAAAGAAGAAALFAMSNVLIGLIPMFIEAVGKGIVLFVKVIADSAKEFVGAFVEIFLAILEAINVVAPVIIETLFDMLVQLLQKMEEAVPLMVDAGLAMIAGILEGIANNIGDIAKAGWDIMIALMDALEEKIPELLDKAAGVLVAFVDGIADAVEKHKQNFIDAGSKLFRGIIDGIGTAIERGGADLRYAGERIANALWNGAMNALGMNSPSKKFMNEFVPGIFEGIEKGNDKNLKRAEVAGADIGDGMYTGVKKTISKIASAIDTDMNFTPTIAPVMDLTSFRRDAKSINNILTPPTLDVETSYSRASSIAVMERENQQTALLDREDAPVEQKTEVSFTQINNSPKALSSAEIYRQTRNQLSKAKGDIEDAH